VVVDSGEGKFLFFLQSFLLFIIIMNYVFFFNFFTSVRDIFMEDHQKSSSSSS
jgi:hypothetical protein